MRPAADGTRRFAATADADELVVNGRSAALLGPHVRATAAGLLGAADMVIESAQLAGTEGQLTASGTIGNELDLAYRLELLRLAPLSPLVGRDLAGTATVAGKVTGPRASPTIEGTLSGRALRVATLAVEAADGTFSARDLADLPEGEIALDLVAKTRRLSLAANYRLKEDGAVALEGLKLTAPQTAVGGDVELSANGLLNGRIRGEVGDLAPIGAFFDRNCSGAATLDLSFAAAGEKQTIEGAIDARGASLAVAGRAPLSAQRLTLKAENRRRLRFARRHGRSARHRGCRRRPRGDAARPRGRRQRAVIERASEGRGHTWSTLRRRRARHIGSRSRRTRAAAGPIGLELRPAQVPPQ